MSACLTPTVLFWLLLAMVLVDQAIWSLLLVTRYIGCSAYLCLEKTISRDFLNVKDHLPCRDCLTV